MRGLFTDQKNKEKQFMGLLLGLRCDIKVRRNCTGLNACFYPNNESFLEGERTLTTREFDAPIQRATEVAILTGNRT